MAQRVPIVNLGDRSSAVPSVLFVGDDVGRSSPTPAITPRTLAVICKYRYFTWWGGRNRKILMIEELRAQINAVRNKLALAQQAGLSHETDLHRARLADLMDIAARHAIDIDRAGQNARRTRLGPAGGEPASGTNGSPTPLPGPTSTCTPT